MPTRVNTERLRQVALAHGHLTDTAISIHTGVSGPTISRIFAETVVPRVDTLVALAGAYGIDLAELLITDKAAA